MPSAPPFHNNPILRRLVALWEPIAGVELEPWQVLEMLRLVPLAERIQAQRDRDRSEHGLGISSPISTSG